jgi:hypothetical protein
MEILIPGLIIVALMVYASTRLKRATTKAFEQEAIETEDFSLVKPEGFLHLINGDPAYAFQAYSKEFGTNGSGEIRRATIDIRKIADRTFEQVCETLGRDAKILDSKHFQLNEMRANSMEIVRRTGDVETVDHYLIIEAPDSVFELRTTVLREHNDDYQRKIDELEESLTIKK